MPAISAVVICFNEERHIERCILSLKPVVDEVVVLDSFSTDRTPEICKSLGVTFYQQKFRGYIEQKNDALALATHDWVLSLDGDEALSDALAESIVRVKEDLNHPGYRFNRLNNFCGQWVRHTNYYPDRKLRLFDRRRGRWGGDNPHDMVVMDGGCTVGYLKGDLLHWMCADHAEHLNTINRFSTIAAREAYQNGVSCSAWKVFYKPLWRFFQYFIIKRGFLDGSLGLVVSRHAAFLCFQKYVRLRHLILTQGPYEAHHKTSLRVAVILTTYNQPMWLQKALWGYAVQTHGDFELIIADDGSGEETRQVIEDFSRQSGMDVRHIWHPDEGFQKCRILNRAIESTQADYLIFSDGDCIPRKDFVEAHIARARKGYFLSGGYFRLNKKVSDSVSREDIQSQRVFSIKWLRKNGQELTHKFFKLLSSKGLTRMMNALTPTRATWNGHNVSGWRSDVVNANGYNEDMGYGGLDRELGERLVNAGIRGQQVRYHAVCLHLDHPRPYKTSQGMQANLSIRSQVVSKKITRTKNGMVRD